jgi:putative effector of murein hydrolase LrgA (UPF0299 family)
MVVPEWGSFLVMVAGSGGLIALVLLDLLIHFAPDAWDAWLEGMKPYLAMLFSFLVPQVVVVVQSVYPTVDPWLWAIVYAVGSYGVHEILYKLIQKPARAAIKAAQ